MAENLAAGNAAVALLANAIATGAGLFTLITIFAPISGAHFNPVVTLSASIAGQLSLRRAAAYVGAQFLGAVTGVLAAHVMFGLPLIQSSAHERGTVGEAVG